MANPQLENGYIRLANELWDAIMSRKFTGRQQKILKLILRLSYGCQSKMAIIPRLSDFEYVGVRIQEARKEIDNLCESRVIKRDNKSTYTLNKNYNEWQISQVAGWDEEKLNQLISQNLTGKVTKSVSESGDKSYEKSKSEVTQSVSLAEKSYEKCNSELTKSVSCEEESYTKCKSEVTKSVNKIDELAEESYEKCKSGLTKSVTSDLRKVEVFNDGNLCGSRAEGLSKDSIKDIIKNNNNSGGYNSEFDYKFASAYQVIEQHFGLTMNPVQVDKLENYLNSGLEPQLIERATDKTRENGKDIRYLWGILDSCVQRGILTASAFDENQERWKGEQYASRSSGATRHSRRGQASASANDAGNKALRHAQATPDADRRDVKADRTELSDDEIFVRR